MPKIDEVLSFLLDGTWRDLLEITQTLQIDYQKLEKIVKLLTEFNFIQTNESKVRITPDTKMFLESIGKNL